MLLGFNNDKKEKKEKKRKNQILILIAPGLDEVPYP